MKELLWQRKGSPAAPSSMKEERRTLIANPSPPQIKENKIILYCNKKIVSVQNDV
jgi:hypothetical protein